MARSTGTTAGRKRLIKTCIGELRVSEQQAKKLGIKPRKRLSPQLEKSCLLLSANVSYFNAATDLKELTGIEVGHSTQQRIVHRQKWTIKSASKTIQALSIDGGKARIRTPEQGQNGWLDYKAESYWSGNPTIAKTQAAIALHESMCGAWFQENEHLLKYANNQPLAERVTCVGDGHPDRKSVV